MSSAVAELDAILQSMLNLKPPGVSGSKITSITTLCTANIQSESVLVQKIYTHFKKTPGTHKLGVLYVVDSVTRQWVDHARKAGQPLGSGAPDGTFAAGVTRITELLPVLMNDIVISAPEDQKAKIKKLVEIWERSNTFPATMLSSIKEKIDSPHAKNAMSTTPEGSPSPSFVPLGQSAPNTNQPLSTVPQQDTSAILQALKGLAKQSTAAPAANGLPGANSMNNILSPPNGAVQPGGSVNQGANGSANGQPVNSLGALFAGLNNPAQSQSPANVPSNPLAGLFSQTAAAPPPPPLAQTPAPVTQDTQAQFQLLQLLAAQGVPPDQWGTALQLLNMQNSAGSGVPGFAPPTGANNNWPGQPSRDFDRPQSPSALYRRRSRSPDYERRREGSPRRRRDSPGFDYRADRERRGNEYRQRSPMGRRRRTPTPPQSDTALPPPGPKVIQWDHNLPKGSIRVLSRTLFVGGVQSGEPHLRGLFARFGIVQTCIVNVDKRHAFVKMLTRRDAEAARHGMEDYKAGDTTLRTKWGVGFGPRDCSDYQTGISIIPIERLTDADRKWMLTAEYGGTGGTTIESGMVVEEPDIEIGAGVSSKAMSRRIPTDAGGKRGPQSSRTGLPEPARKDRYREDDRGDGRSNNDMSNTNGMMAGLQFPFQMQNGMPILPPGFQLPFPTQQNNGS